MVGMFTQYLKPISSIVREEMFFYFLPKVNRFLYLLLIKVCKGTFLFTAFEK